ncbi:hypothetical protein [Serratia marcescens]|uniref:hypothetical protein n=1 Tax=Serratia marcescens TaxID=615 RepID=UPI0029D96ED4|nr:hypothetical protein [Serratia marcescens]MDX7487218.1 hypothetical protein [Serratia marcescens]
MYKHTPGPWVVDEDEHSTAGGLIGIYVSQNGDGRIGQVFGNCLVTTDDELRANAALFAAAPDLLTALEGIMSQMHGSRCTDGCYRPVIHGSDIERAITALRKAHRALDHQLRND